MDDDQERCEFVGKLVAELKNHWTNRNDPVSFEARDHEGEIMVFLSDGTVTVPRDVIKKLEKGKIIGFEVDPIYAHRYSVTIWRDGLRKVDPSL